MSEPLNDFLESVETAADDESMTYEAFGYFVRDQLRIMRKREAATMKAPIHTMINAHGFPVAVMIPQEG